MYKIFVDGSCPKNGLDGASGGWGYIVVDKDYNIITKDYGKLRKGQQSSTRAELEGLYRALLAIKDLSGNFEIVTDYKTLVDLITGLGSRNANRDMWDQIEPIMLSMAGRIVMTHVTSHSQNGDNVSIHNNLVDKLARQGANSLLIAPVI